MTVREQAQFEANVTRPGTSAFGSDAFPTAWDKAGALLHSFATTQCLVDGNKRTAWAAAWLLLRMNCAVGKLSGAVDPDVAEDFVGEVASGTVDVPEIADRLRAFVHPQLGISGHLPAGFRVETPLEDVGNALIGSGTTPDGSRYVYLYMLMPDGSPYEMLLTPEQAEETAKSFFRFADKQTKQIELSVSAYVRHVDLDTPPPEMR